jgi:hypothetical protein
VHLDVHGAGPGEFFAVGAGRRVAAFDISPSAIAMCKTRYPDSAVDYRVADLFAPPDEWRRGFDLVYECNTIQILSGEARGQSTRVSASDIP